jgi:hypothetical protein
MIVVGGDEQHVGKYVRRVSYFFNERQSDDMRWFIVGVVDRSGPRETMKNELLEYHPDDLELVNEGKDDKMMGNDLFETVRYAAKVSKPEVRRPGEGNLGHLHNASSILL